MAKYLIKTCESRRWYVEQFLIPSMVDQGISRSDIIFYFDINKVGCLETSMSAFAISEEFNCEGVWYLQDDVIISNDFKAVTEKYDGMYDIICGFCRSTDPHRDIKGITNINHMWYSFPCLYVSKEIAVACAKWFYEDVVYNPEYRLWVNARKYDDSIFDIYVQDFKSDASVFLIYPNIVDHIDYLIGGSVVNAIRSDIMKSDYFDKQLVENLREKLSKTY